MAVKAQLKGINSSFPLCWSQGLDSGPRFDLVYLYLLSRLTGPVITLKSLYIYIQIYVYTYIYKRVLFVLKHILPYFLGSVSTFIFSMFIHLILMSYFVYQESSLILYFSQKILKIRTLISYFCVVLKCSLSDIKALGIGLS